MSRTVLVTGAVIAATIVAYAAAPSRTLVPLPRTEAPPPQGPSGRTDVVPRGSSVLAGEVRDAAGSPLAGAVVDAQHAASSWRALVLADRAGRFRIEGVPTGSVTLVARRGGLEITGTATVGAGVTTVRLAPPAQEAREAAASSGPGGVASQVMRSNMGGPMAIAASPTMAGAEPPSSMDAYARVDPSGFRRVSDAPLSTFSIDVDTASYSNARRFLMEGGLPPVDAVRVEEWINYFPYAYASPEGRDAFRVSSALTTCPWAPSHQLLRIGVRARSVPRRDTPARNLVFLVDVSGSMLSRDKLPLVQTALRMLVDDLTARDRIALVVYAGRTETVLPSTPGDQKARIHEALARLQAGGSTNGAGGIQLAYRAAREGFLEGGVNRVVLATDGDFNVGVTSLGELTRLVEEERKSGVFLSVLGVGRGNLKDATLEALADRGNGNYAYIDSLQEARRVLVEQVGATLIAVAKDVKLQVEFNPAHVAGYRLIGYENRALQTEDFTNDAKDAGEIGAGHTVTALYEIVPPGREGDLPGATPLRYQRPARAATDARNELATVNVRHKAPGGDVSTAQVVPVAAAVSAADTETAFAIAVAEAGLVLRKDPLAPGASLDAAVRRASQSLGADPGGWRAEFVRLMGLASSLQALGPAGSEP